MKKALLALEDGTVFAGRSFGSEGEVFGEVVFNTSMTGYQEILTDPSYAGQLVCMTYPQIGNYGTNSADDESRRPFVEGFIVRESSATQSNWRAEHTIDEYLEEHKIVGIQEIDTRALVKHIRLQGAMRGVISSNDLNKERLVEKARSTPSLVGRDLVATVTCKNAYRWNGEQASGRNGRFKVTALDFGMKFNILRELAARGCDVTVVPAGTSATQILEARPDGVFLSNGPGDPKGVGYAVETVRTVLGKIPVFGICLGHQILGLALGLDTYKLKFGHRGANHPVKNLVTAKVEITTQNHGFAVYPEVNRKTAARSRDFGRVEITHLNLNDGTVEGLRVPDVRAFSVQYHPEAAPGPHDAKYLFSRFVDDMTEWDKAKQTNRSLGV